MLIKVHGEAMLAAKLNVHGEASVWTLLLTHTTKLRSQWS